MDWDSWGGDILSPENVAARRTAPVQRIPAERGLVVETRSGFVGAVVGIEAGNVRLEDRHGAVRLFPLGLGFLAEGLAVELVKPAGTPNPGATRTASGSRAVTDHRSRVAIPSRILVEGTHDAELVEHVWGHDLRVEGVVVEPLGGIDDLGQLVADMQPSATRRLGILVDHLVPGSKESRIADAVRRGPHGAHIRIVGHPYIDIWQAVRPARVGLSEWPEIPRSEDWKRGTLRRLGMPHDDQADVARGWKAILGRVRTWTDLEPELIGRVEELIDFVTAP